MSERPRILVVDDIPTNIRLLEAVLEPRGYDVVGAASGPEALEVASARLPDLVVLDLNMPGMNGHEVCRRLRADPATAVVPVLVVTAGGNHEKVAALDAGADDFVLRPFDQAELLARIRSLLRIKAYHDTVELQRAELAAWARTLEERVEEQLAELDRFRNLRRFLSNQLAQVVAAGDETLLIPHRAEVAVVFCDLRGFTAFGADAEPEDVVRVLRSYHELLGAAVAAHEATVGFFAGDGVMLFFNDPVPCPDPAARAVALAGDLRDGVTELTAPWRAIGHELGVGLAVSTGYATLGCVGFEGRWEYTAIGPVVNLASRLCDEAAAAEILLCPRTVAQLGSDGDPGPWRELTLRGFRHPVRACSIAPPAPAPAPGPAPTPTARHATPGTTRTELRVLGPLEVIHDGRDVPVTAARERALLALLAAAQGRVVPVDRLAEELWAGEPPERAAASLRVYVSRLRRTLADAGLDDLLVTRPPGYAVDIAADGLDVARFEALLARGRAALEEGDGAGASALLAAGLALWRGAALCDAASAPDATLEAARLEELRLVAVELRVEADLACGRHGEVVAEVEALVARYPLRERLWGHLMLALHRSGRQAEALRAYQSLRRTFAEQLGLEPSPELVALERAIATRAPVA